MALILAPNLDPQHVFGVEQSCCPQVFRASPSPPDVNDIQVAWVSKGSAAETVGVVDRPVATDRSIPVWGVLFACTASNIEPNLQSVRNTFAAEDADTACVAANELRRHADMLDPSTRIAVQEVRLPDALLPSLAAQRVWRADAVLDLALHDEVSSDTPAAKVCVLNVEGLDVLDCT